MRNIFIPILLILLNSCFAKDSAPQGLMVEFLRNPEFIEINEAKPDFSWIVPSSLEKQTAWQIQVASSKNLLTSDNPDFWDSGKINNNQSINVEYNGKPLVENSTYFWRVKIWDIHGNQSNFSVEQQFKTGRLSDYTTTINSFLI